MSSPVHPGIVWVDEHVLTDDLHSNGATKLIIEIAARVRTRWASVVQTQDSLAANSKTSAFGLAPDASTFVMGTRLAPRVGASVDSR
ncbi:MAG: hypothetical protein H0V07_10690 [Propionibacteriales bacterium]|nr:hypothetical protein [Propionibacteriales bacterium]